MLHSFHAQRACPQLLEKREILDRGRRRGLGHDPIKLNRITV